MPIAKNVPQVSNGIFSDPSTGRTIVLGTPEWSDWLNKPSSPFFDFQHHLGALRVHKQGDQTSLRWVAYSLGKKVPLQQSLGTQVSQARLEDLARQLFASEATIGQLTQPSLPSNKGAPSSIEERTLEITSVDSQSNQSPTLLQTLAKKAIISQIVKVLRDVALLSLIVAMLALFHDISAEKAQDASQQTQVKIVEELLQVGQTALALNQSQATTDASRAMLEAVRATSDVARATAQVMRTTPSLEPQARATESTLLATQAAAQSTYTAISMTETAIARALPVLQATQTTIAATGTAWARDSKAQVSSQETPQPQATSTMTLAPTIPVSGSLTSTPTDTPSPVMMSPSPMSSLTPTPSATSTPRSKATATATSIAAETPTTTITRTPAVTPTSASTSTVRPSYTPTNTAIPKVTTTATRTPVVAPTSASTPTVRPSYTPTATITSTPTPSPKPHYVVMTPIADTYVRNGSNANENFGFERYLIVKDGSDRYDRRAFLCFDLAGLQGSVSNAMLRLTVNKLPNGTPAPLRLIKADDRWSEYEMTWNNQPAPQANYIAEAMIIQSGVVEFDITNYVNAEIAGDKIVTVEIVDDTIARRMIRFWSREGIAPPTLQLLFTRVTR